MKNLKIIFKITIFNALLLFLSCATTSYNYEDENWTINNNVAIFISSNEYNTDYWYYSDDYEREYNQFEVEVEKKLGDEDDGYGLIFNYINDENFINLLIDTDGYITIVQIKDDEWIEIFPWTYTKLLNEGFNVKNSLQVNYTIRNEEALYNVFVNGKVFFDFSLTGIEIGNQGYFAAVGETDNVLVVYNLID